MKNIRLYLLKIQGEAKIPDYIQVRDANFSLIGYYRPGRIKKLMRYPEHSEKIIAEISKKVQDLPFGKVIPIDICL